MAHQGGQFRQVLGSELVQCRLERLLADLVGLEKFCGVVDHCRFSGTHSWEGSALPQRVNQGIAYPGPAGGGRMRVPDIGAVHSPAVVMMASSWMCLGKVVSYRR